MTGTMLWLDGKLVAEDDARVSPFDHGLLVGDGVFETLRVYNGIPFAWTRHHERLVRSAAGLGLTAPGSQELRAAVDDVLAANGLTDGRVRLTVTGAPDRDRYERAGEAVATDGRRRDRPMEPQRARRGRRTQDDLVRRERARACTCA